MERIYEVPEEVQCARPEDIYIIDNIPHYYKIEVDNACEVVKYKIRFIPFKEVPQEENNDSTTR